MIALCLAAAAWILSRFWMVQVQYEFGTTVAPGAPHGEPDMWTFRARRIFANSFGGTLKLGHSEYRSLAPTRDGLLNWASYGGWSTMRLAGVSVKPDDRAPIYFESTSEFSFLGLGVHSAMRGGEESRLVSIPYWIPAIVLVSVALACMRPGHQRRFRARRGLCVRCGYDLAGGTQQCPECGHDQGNSDKS
jgi:hypothetical protein